MKILDDVKLDFSDVLLLPKRSQYSSRSEVSLERTFKFKYSKYSWTGVPIIVSNMDTTGTIEMALELQKHKILTCLHKYYTLEDLLSEPCQKKDDDKQTYLLENGHLSKNYNEFKNFLVIRDAGND